jgi:hypothetical protein
VLGIFSYIFVYGHSEGKNHGQGRWESIHFVKIDVWRGTLWMADRMGQDEHLKIEVSRLRCGRMSEAG